MSIASQITRLQNAKTAIKASIVAKGVTVPSNATFDSYSGYVDSINTGVASPWTRPSDWIALPSITSSDNKVVGIVAVYSTDGKPNTLTLSASGNYTIDWGDGTIENYSSSTVCSHTYTYATCGGTLSSLGYKTCAFTLTMQSGQSFTSFNGNPNTYTNYNSILDIAISGSSLSSVSFSYPLYKCQRAQILRFAGSYLSSVFANCGNLHVCTIQNCSSVTNAQYLFMYCSKLESFDCSGLPNLTNAMYMFEYCVNISTVNVSALTKVTGAINMFNNCAHLRSIIGFSSLVTVQTAQNMFASCYSLTSLDLSGFSSFQSGSGIFSYATYLTSVTLPATWPSCTSLASFFNTTPGIKTISIGGLTNLTSISEFCSAPPLTNDISVIESVTLSGNSTGLTTIYDAFEYNKNVTTIDFSGLTLTAVTNASYAFDGCYSLRSLILNTLSNASLSTTQMFRECRSLISLRIPGIVVSFSLSGCALNASALNQVFTDLGTVSGKTITITGNPGAGTCTQSIATAKGWTVTN